MKLDIIFQGIEESEVLVKNIEKHFSKLTRYVDKPLWGKVNVSKVRHEKSIRVSIYEDHSEYHASAKADSYSQAIKMAENKISYQMVSAKKRWSKRKMAA